MNHLFFLSSPLAQVTDLVPPNLKYTTSEPVYFQSLFPSLVHVDILPRGRDDQSGGMSMDWLEGGGSEKSTNLRRTVFYYSANLDGDLKIKSASFWMIHEWAIRYILTSCYSDWPFSCPSPSTRRLHRQVFSYLLNTLLLRLSISSKRIYWILGFEWRRFARRRYVLSARGFARPSFFSPDFVFVRVHHFPSYPELSIACIFPRFIDLDTWAQRIWATKKDYFGWRQVRGQDAESACRATRQTRPQQSGTPFELL